MSTPLSTAALNTLVKLNAEHHVTHEFNNRSITGAKNTTQEIVIKVTDPDPKLQQAVINELSHSYGACHFSISTVKSNGEPYIRVVVGYTIVLLFKQYPVTQAQFALA